MVISGETPGSISGPGFGTTGSSFGIGEGSVLGPEGISGGTMPGYSGISFGSRASMGTDMMKGCVLVRLMLREVTEIDAVLGVIRGFRFVVWSGMALLTSEAEITAEIDDIFLLGFELVLLSYFSLYMVSELVHGEGHVYGIAWRRHLYAIGPSTQNGLGLACF